MILGSENWPQTVSQLASQSHMFYVSDGKSIDKNISLSYWFVIDYCFLVAAKSLQSCSTLCNPVDGSPPGFPVPGILQARTLEWVAISFSNAWKWKVKSESEVAQSCPTISYPMVCSLPGSSAYGIFQVRVLEWVAIAFSGFLGTQWLMITLFFGPEGHMIYSLTLCIFFHSQQKV